MNTNLPPTEPLDEQERELARIVRALPGGEPPPALDARILRDAANAAAASRRPSARWLASAASLWGIGGAAAAVLALGVSWQMIYGNAHSGVESVAAPAAMSEADEQSPVAVEFKPQPAEAAATAQALPPAAPPALPAVARNAAPAGTRRQDQPAPESQLAAAPEPQAFAEDHLDEHVAARAESSDARDNGGTSAGALAAPALAERATGTAMAKAAADSSAPAAPALGGAARERQQAPLKPSTWLARIRELRDAQRYAEARASLLEFHRRYPDFVIPSDLAPLLRE